jgi:DNA-binding NarL/FixJ family response regulator
LIHDLTGRELQILTALANGWTVVRVARELNITTQTVKNHIGSAYKRLQVKNRYEAFLELGWLTPPVNQCSNKRNGGS